MKNIRDNKIEKKKYVYYEIYIEKKVYTRKIYLIKAYIKKYI